MAKSILYLPLVSSRITSMKKLLLIAIASLIAIVSCVVLVSAIDPDVIAPKEYHSPGIINSDVPATSHASIRQEFFSVGQSNSSKTGSVVLLSMQPADQFYCFVRDFKKSRSKPIFLCHMNQTSTQGSYSLRWSKDKQMVAVYDESSLRFPEMKLPKWVIGYDWKRSQVLHSKDIVRAFTFHGGIGSGSNLQNPHELSPQELRGFEPEKLNPDRRMP